MIGLPYVRTCIVAGGLASASAARGVPRVFNRARVLRASRNQAAPVTGARPLRFAHAKYGARDVESRGQHSSNSP